MNSAATTYGIYFMIVCRTMLPSLLKLNDRIESLCCSAVVPAMANRLRSEYLQIRIVRSSPPVANKEPEGLIAYHQSYCKTDTKNECF